MSSVCVGVCVCVCGCVAGAGWGLLLVWVWLWLVCAVVGPSPLLAEVSECDIPPPLLGFAIGGGGCSSPLLAEGPGCGSPPLLAGVRWRRWCVVACHSWLRVPVAVPRHSWPGGSAGGGVGWAPATPGCGSRGRLPATPGSGPPAAAVGVSAGGGFPCCVCLRRSVCVCCLCWCVWCVCVFVVSVLVVVWALAGLPRVFVYLCVCACVVCWWRAVWCNVVCWWGCGWCVVWLVPRHSWRRFLCATPHHPLLGFAAGGGGRSSPLLAEGLGDGSPPLLAGVCRPRQLVFPRPGDFLCCVCLWRGACWCVRCVFVAVVLVWVCLPCVLAHVWRRVALCFPGWGLLLVLVWVGVWLVCGRSLATPDGGSCVRFPAASGWVALPVVVGVPRHSWLRAPGAVPCHSWLGFAGGGGVWLLAPFGCGPGYGSRSLLAGVRRPGRWPFAWGWVGVSRGVCVCGAVRARVVSVLVCV